MSERPRTRHVEVGDGVSLAFDEWTDAGRPVVFLHATGFSRGIWRPIASQLVDRCAPVAVDLRGHGGSSRPEPPYVWSQIADEVATVIEREDWSQLVICGHSVGGAISVEVAWRLPERVDAVVLTEAVLRAPDSSQPERRGGPSDLIERTKKRRFEWPSRDEAAAYLRERMPYDAWEQAVFDSWIDTALLKTDGGVELSCPPWAEAATFEGARGSKAYDHLPELQCPVWVLRGAGDRGLPSTTTPEVAQRISTVHESVIEDVGHFLPQERSDLVVDAVTEALEATAP